MSRDEQPVGKGCLVTVGTGRKTWTVYELWESNGIKLATLDPTIGYSRTTVPVSQLRHA